MIFVIVVDVLDTSCDYSATISSNFLQDHLLEITAKPANLPAKTRGLSRAAVSCTASQSEPQGQNGFREKFSDGHSHSIETLL